MTMKLYVIICGMAFVLLLAACTKNEPVLTSSNKDEWGLHVPQGNADYDKRIVGYHERWGTYLLYKFSDLEFSWNVTNVDTMYKGIGADPNYINQQLDLLENTFFNFYSDSTLKKYLPIKFMLCSSLTFQKNRVDALLLNGPVNAGYEVFAVNWGNSRIANITSPVDSLSIFRSNVNLSFLRMMQSKKYSSLSNQFIAVSDYTVFWGAPDAMNKRGFLANGSSYGSSPLNKDMDWDAFLKMIISNPYSYLTDPATTASDPSAKGVLTTVKDSSGLIARKYKAMIDYYKDNFNIDLQRIGNGK